MQRFEVGFEASFETPPLAAPQDERSFTAEVRPPFDSSGPAPLVWTGGTRGVSTPFVLRSGFSRVSKGAPANPGLPGQPGEESDQG